MVPRFMLLFWGVSIQKWFFSISIPPLMWLFDFYSLPPPKVWSDVMWQSNLKVRNMFSKQIYGYKIHWNFSLNIAQTTQYPTYVVYLTSFSRDSHQEIVLLYFWYQGIWKRSIYIYIHMDHMFVKPLQMESLLGSNVKSLKLNE